MHQLDRDLTDSGKLVFQQGLADPSTAKTVTFDSGGVVISDGPYAGAKESLIGFWVVDVASEDRVYEVAAKMPPCGPSRGSARGGYATHLRIGATVRTYRLVGLHAPLTRTIWERERRLMPQAAVVRS